MSTLFRPTFSKRLLFFLMADLLLFYVALHLSYALRFDFVIDPRHMEHFPRVLGVLLLCKMLFMFLFRVYNITWRYFSLGDGKRLLYAHAAAAAVFAAIFWLMPEFFTPMPRSVIIIDFFLSLILTGALRISKRVLLEQGKGASGRPALLVGVNHNTASVVRSALGGELEYFPSAIVAMLEQNRSVVNTYIGNVRVYGEEAIETLVKEQGIRSAIITQHYPPEMLKRLYERLDRAGVSEVKIVKLLGGRYDKLEELSIEDLLARHPKDLDTGLIGDFIRGRRVLITGAGGSIGSEIARQCRRFGTASLVLVDNGEYNLYSVGEEVGEAELHLCSVTEREALEKVFEGRTFDIVIHAAAFKHVPLCEANVEAAVRNNVLGTKNVIDLSIERGVGRVVVISTDKAVRPTSVMGATKRVSELYAQNVRSGETEIVAVRFGNVLGSSGSVIPKFKRQIEAGGPVTVTHPEMTRYFMLIPEACQLVLQAGAIAEGGELFILDMGEPVKIVDLARQMIRLYGREGEVEIAFSGLRPGEKMYEELLISEEERKTRYASIYIANPTPYDIETLERDIGNLLSAEEKIAALRAIVPEFDHR